MVSHRPSFSFLRITAAGFFVFILALAPYENAFASIEGEIDAILSRPAVSGNTWSVLIETEEGEVLYARTPATARRPASVTKLFPTAAAFDLLGPDYIWNGERIEIASRPINRSSNNSMADDLFRYLGATQGSAYTYSEGRRIVEGWVADAGISTSGLVLNDGSGLSWNNRISPVQAIGVLRYALDNFPTYQATLSRACHYGTLSSRFCGTEGARNVYGKTGTLPNGQTVSLSGIFDHDGRRYFFSFFANNVTNNTSTRLATRQAIDDAILVLANPRSTAFAGGDWIETTASSLRLREGPGTNYDTLDSLPEGTIVRVQPHEDNGVHANGHHWWFARVHSDGQEGWLAETFLDPSAPPDDWQWPDVIVDNSDPGFSASPDWNTATWADDKFGPDYRHRDTEQVGDLAFWSADLPAGGAYDLYAWWPAWDNRPTEAPYIVTHKEGSEMIPMNQTENGGRWNHLGRFDFGHDSSDQVALLPATSSGDVIVADAVRFVPIEVELPRFPVSVAMEGSGQVEKTPEASEYEKGESVELRAFPDEEFTFAGWNGDMKSSENPIFVTVNEPVSLTARFARTYDAWAAAHFTGNEQQDEEISGETATPGGDNIPNLLKYALGLDPHKPAGSPLPLPRALPAPDANGETFLTLTFSHPSGIEDVEYQVQLSSDLSDWSESAVLVAKEEEAGTITRTYRDIDPFGVSDHKFMRLRVNRKEDTDAGP